MVLKYHVQCPTSTHDVKAFYCSKKGVCYCKTKQQRANDAQRHQGSSTHANPTQPSRAHIDEKLMSIVIVCIILLYLWNTTKDFWLQVPPLSTILKWHAYTNEKRRLAQEAKAREAARIKSAENRRVRQLVCQDFLSKDIIFSSLYLAEWLVQQGSGTTASHFINDPWILDTNKGKKDAPPGSGINTNLRYCLNENRAIQHQSTMLHVAATQGDDFYSNACDDGAPFVHKVDVLIAAGADANVVDNKGQTPLHCAARFGNAEAVVALRSGGACAHSTDATAHNTTPLTSLNVNCIYSTIAPSTGAAIVQALMSPASRELIL